MEVLGSGGPFGIHPAMTLSEILSLGAGPVEDQPLSYELTGVPRQNPRFESYIVRIGRGLVAGVTALGKDIDTSVYGEAVRKEFNSFSDTLQRKYGSYKRYDFLKVGSIWDEPKDWTTALLKDERVLCAVWGGDHGSVLGDRITGIALQARVSDDGMGYMTLEYIFDNYREHMAELKALQDEGL
jgi:hypothetical protein